MLLARDWSQVADDILAQKFSAGRVARRHKKIERDADPSWDGNSARRSALLNRASQLSDSCEDLMIARSSNASPALDYWGLQGGYSRRKRTRVPSMTSHRYMLALQMGATKAAVVQPRPAMGLRHRRPGQGHLYATTRPAMGRSRSTPTRSPAARYFRQSIEDDLVNETGHGPVGCARRACSSRGPGHRLPTSQDEPASTRSCGSAANRGSDELLKIGRPRGAPQVGRHGRGARAKMVVATQIT